MTAIKNEWNAQKAIRSCMFGPSITRNLIMRVLTICHVKLTRSTVMGQKGFDLRYLSPALCNLWLLLVFLITWMYLQRRGYLHTIMFGKLSAKSSGKQTAMSICGSHGCLRDARNNIARCISAPVSISILSTVGNWREGSNTPRSFVLVQPC